MLTDQELRQAVFAMSIIDERGTAEEFAIVLREKAETSANGERLSGHPSRSTFWRSRSGQAAV